MDSLLELLESEHLTREGTEHLRRECPWFRHVEQGGRDHPDLHCRPAADGGGALVKFTPRTPEASTVVKPTVPPGGPGLFRMKGHHLPPYIEHLYPHLVARYGKHGAYRVANGIVHKWAAGINPGGKHPTKTHPDVRAAAQRNVAEWEKEKAEAHEHHGDRVKATAPAAPGVRGGIYDSPMQTVGPRPPLPPAVSLPTAAEVRAVILLVPDCSDANLSSTARKFLEQAAAKLDRDDPLEALAVMRSAMTALYAGHKADLGDTRPSAMQGNMFAPPAERSSATAGMLAGRDKATAWRKAQLHLAALADRTRKHCFRGVFTGPGQQARLTEDDMTALDRFLELAAVTGKDVSEPTVSDTSGATPLIQLPENLLTVSDPKASAEMASLPALDKAKVSAYMERARAMLATNPAGAAQSAIRAAVIAHESGAHHLAKHIRSHVQALAEGGNTTKTAEQAGVMSAGGRTVTAGNSPDAPRPAKLSAVELLLAGAGAGSSAGHSAGRSISHARPLQHQAPGPDAHQLHVEHVEHLHHLHQEHVEHLEHLHHLHVEHMASQNATASEHGDKARSVVRKTAAAPKHNQVISVKTPKPRGA
jgi:hypothetical protein